MYPCREMYPLEKFYYRKHSLDIIVQGYRLESCTGT